MQMEPKCLKRFLLSLQGLGIITLNPNRAKVIEALPAVIAGSALSAILHLEQTRYSALCWMR